MTKRVIKKDGTSENFDCKKIINAVTKSADRVNIVLTTTEEAKMLRLITDGIISYSEMEVSDLHKKVELALDKISPDVAKSYREYRDYKTDIGLNLMADINGQVQKILSDTDKENSNSNLRFISTKRTSVAKTFSKELYQKMEIDTNTLKMMKDGFIYIHDLSDLLMPSFNCLLVKTKDILTGGFTVEGIYNPEPKGIRTAVGHITGIIANISGNSYGGTTIPEVDKVLAPYYNKSIDANIIKLISLGVKEDIELKARAMAYEDMKQSLQALENRLNSEGSSRGSYPFTTFSFGSCDNSLEEDVCRAILEVRMEGHGAVGFKKSVIFPKLVFIHDEEKHGKGMIFESLFNLSVLCSSKCMYPDYIGSFYKRHGKTISPMGK